jgi:hypothetical protein
MQNAKGGPGGFRPIRDALSRATFRADGECYILIGLPPDSIAVAAGVIAAINAPFVVMIADGDEVSLLISTMALERFGERLGEYVAGDELYALITVDAVLEPALVGFIAHLGGALAEAGIPIFPYAAYSRDHIVVPASRLGDAMSVLERLKGEAVAES